MAPAYPKTGTHTPPNLTLDELVARARTTANEQGRTHTNPYASAPVWLAGRPCGTATEVIDTYTPSAKSPLTQQQWAEHSNFVRDSVRASNPRTASTAFTRIQIVAAYLAWCLADDVPVHPEQVFLPHRVEHYCATAIAHRTTRTLSTVRGALRSVGEASTRRAPWPHRPETHQKHSYVQSPYTGAQVAHLIEACDAQGTPTRRHAMKAMVTLGLGAGLTSWEMAELHASDVITHPTYDQVRIIVLPSRIVPARAPFVTALDELCLAEPEGPLAARPPRKGVVDPLSVARLGLHVPEALSTLTIDRLRTTWAVDCLSSGLALPDFLPMTTATTGQNLRYYVPHLHLTAPDAAWVLRASNTTSTEA